ncbi:MAG: SdrD B-like domain-containing protein, partial [Tepidisphaeraceae bacterium]
SSSVTVTPGGTTTLDLLAKQGTWSFGRIFNDLNANGVQDPGETGMAGVQVFASYNAQPSPASGDPVAITDASGQYFFPNGAGLNGKRLQVVVPSGYYTTTTASTFWIPNGSVGNVPGPTFGISNAPRPGNIQFNYAVDLNGDGSVTTADTAATQIALRIFEDTNGNATYDSDEPGGYLVSGSILPKLAFGPHTFRVDLPAGWTSSLPDNELNVSVPDNATVVLPAFTVTPGLPQDAVSLRGRLFQDSDFSQINTPDKPAVGGAQVWIDSNANGVLDPAEPYAYSDAAGRYAFSGLVAGTQHVHFNFGSYVTAGPSSATTYDAILSGTPVVHDVPLYPLSQSVRYAVQVRLDANGNGILDDTDPALAQTRIVVQGSTVATDSQGKYSTTGPSGLYAPSVDSLSGYTIVGTPPSTTLYAGQSSLDNVLLLSGTSTSLSTLSGTVYRDANYDGQRQSGEAGQGNIRVFVDTNGDGTLTAGEPSALTNSTGAYTIQNIPVGAWDVLLENPVNEYQLTSAQKYNVAFDNSTITGITFAIAPQNGQIGGRVFYDYNANNVFDSTDDGLGFFSVYLDLNNNLSYDAGIDVLAMTDTLGFYHFSGLPINRPEVVRLNSPVGYSSASAAVLTPTPATPTVTHDFGVTNGTGKIIGGTQYHDWNQNGQRDSNESAESNYAVTLTNLATNQ